MSKVNWWQCVAMCSTNAEFVATWCKMTGYYLSVSPINKLIDEATGWDKRIASQFLAFVRDIVWNRLPAEHRDGEWPAAIGDDEVCMLPKPDAKGGVQQEPAP